MGTFRLHHCFEIMAGCNSDTSVSGPVSGRAEVIAAIEDLAAKVAHLERSLRSLAPTKAPPASEAIEKEEIKEEINIALSEAFLAPVDDPQPDKSEEAAIFPLSPHQNMPCNVCIAEVSAQSPFNLEAPAPEPKQGPRREENAVAARVAELCDRLGGFKASLLDVPDQGT
jgi:hypothetical protein